MRQSSRDLFDKYIYQAAVFLLIWTAGIVAITAVLFLFGISITVCNVLFPLIGSCMWISNTEKNKKDCCNIIIISIFLAIFFALFSGMSYDKTWDGAAYHKQAVGLLKEGWNPVYMDAMYYNSISNSIPNGIAQIASSPLLWAETYPKASWYLGASVYYITGNIETGKIYNFLSMFILFGLSYHLFYLSTKKVRLSITVAALMACNPISLAQIQSFYVDGFAGCILLAVILELSYVISNKISKTESAILFSLMILGCNLKFSITAFTALFFIIYYLSYVTIHWHEFKLFMDKFIKLAGAAFFSIVIVGFAPYITNCIRYGEILAGYSSMDLSDNAINQYFGIQGINRIQRSLYSLFGRMSHGEYAANEILKIPFTFTSKELDNYYIVDLRVSAFGMFFSGIFIISLIVIAVWIFKKHKTFTNGEIMLLIFSGITFIELFAFTTSYQMRYVPHLYIIPVLAFFIITCQNKYQVKLKHHMFSTIFLLLILLNITPWIKAGVQRQYEGIKIREELQSLAKMSEESENIYIAFWSYDFNGIHYNLKDNGVDHYNFTDQSEMQYMDNFQSIYGNWIMYSCQ